MARKAGTGFKLRQSYARVGSSLITHQRAHAKRFKRSNRAFGKLKTYLSCVIRDISRKVGDIADLLDGIVLERMLSRTRRVLEQKQPQRGRKVCSEVECSGKDKARRPYEFGVKVSVATTLAHAKGGQFAAHSRRSARQAL